MAKRERESRPMPSRQWTCSELSSGHKELMAAKKEKETPEELQKKIQDLSLNHVLWYIGCAQVW